MATKLVTCTNEEWVNCAVLGANSVLIQMASNGPIKVFMGEDAPLAASDVGVVLDRNALAEIAFNGIPAGQDFWIRGIDPDEEKVTIMFA